MRRAIQLLAEALLQVWMNKTRAYDHDMPQPHFLDQPKVPRGTEALAQIVWLSAGQLQTCELTVNNLVFYQQSYGASMRTILYNLIQTIFLEVKHGPIQALIKPLIKCYLSLCEYPLVYFGLYQKYEYSASVQSYKSIRCSHLQNTYHLFTLA